METKEEKVMETMEKGLPMIRNAGDDAACRLLQSGDVEDHIGDNTGLYVRNTGDAHETFTNTLGYAPSRDEHVCKLSRLVVGLLRENERGVDGAEGNKVCDAGTDHNDDGDDLPSEVTDLTEQLDRERWHDGALPAEFAW